MTTEDARLVLKKLENYEALDKRGREPDPVGWIAYHYSCTREQAERKIAQAKKKLGR